MQLTPQNLTANGFELFETVAHSDYKPFLQKLKWNYSKLHLIYSFCLCLSIIGVIFLILTSHEIYFFKILYALLGVVLAIILVLVHEIIHYMMYMIFGADKIQIKRYEGTDYIFTLADHFVVGKKKIIWIALMPYLVISILCLVAMLVSNDQMQILLSSTILFHTSMCKEDFRIIYYFFSQNADVKMYTDIKAEKTYFYQQSDSSL